MTTILLLFRFLLLLLILPHSGVDAIRPTEQLFVRSSLRDFPVFEDEDLVGVDHRRQPVGDDDGGPVFRDDVERRLDVALRLRVEGRRGFVQQEDGRRLKGNKRGSR